MTLLIVAPLIAFPWESFSPSSDLKAFYKILSYAYVGQVDWPSNQSSEYKLAQSRSPTVLENKASHFG